MMFPFIVACAIKSKTGKRIYTLPRPARHYDILHTFFPNVSVNPKDQGFITNAGKFVDRYKAMKIALKSGQHWRKNSVVLDKLYSENLW